MSDLIYDERLMRSLSISAGVSRNFHDLFEPYALAPSSRRLILDSYYNSLDCRSVISTERDILFLFLYDIKKYKQGRTVSYMNCEFTQSICQGRLLGRLHGTRIFNSNSEQLTMALGYNWSEFPAYDESPIDIGVIPVLNATPSILEQALEKIPEYREHLQTKKIILAFNGSPEKDNIENIGLIVGKYIEAKDSISFRAFDEPTQKEIVRVWLSKRDY